MDRYFTDKIKHLNLSNQLLFSPILSSDHPPLLNLNPQICHADISTLSHTHMAAARRRWPLFKNKSSSFHPLARRSLIYIEYNIIKYTQPCTHQWSKLSLKSRFVWARGSVFYLRVLRLLLNIHAKRSIGCTGLAG
jgi:hypothetical protein